VRQILEIDKSEPVRSVIPASIRVASKPGDVEGVSTSWALVELPDRPFVLTVMTNYGDSDLGREVIRDVAKTTFEYLSRLARSTPNGARVPHSVKAARP
jgi:beta-lactamase class A